MKKRYKIARKKAIAWLKLHDVDVSENASYKDIAEQVIDNDDKVIAELESHDKPDYGWFLNAWAMRNKGIL